jgi:hypothetical protein
MAQAQAVRRIFSTDPRLIETPNPLRPEYPSVDSSLEKHYSVIEISKLWGLSENTIRRMFTGEPGVIEWGSEEGRFKRAYKTMRVPESVLHRVHRRLVKTS